jgi:hypothetical protein
VCCHTLSRILTHLRGVVKPISNPAFDLSVLGQALAGWAVAVPVFIKQNVGLVFFALTCGALLLLWIIHAAHKRPAGYGAILTGALRGLPIGALLIEVMSGLGNYLHWTMAYAASHRMPTLHDMLEIYKGQSLPISLLCFALGAFVLWWGQKAGWAVVSAIIVVAPFVWPSVYLLLETDPSERIDRLLNVWPAVLIASLVIGLLSLRSKLQFSGLLPFILFGTINAAFMSQQLWVPCMEYGRCSLFSWQVHSSVFLFCSKCPPPGSLSRSL